MLSIPEPAFVAEAAAAAAAGSHSFSYRSGFAVTFRGSAELDVLRYVPDSGSVPPRPFIVRDDAIPISINASARAKAG